MRGKVQPVTEATAITVPDLGFDGEPVLVGQWLVTPGDEVVAGDRLCELLCASVLFYAEAETGGTFAEAAVRSGSSVGAGQHLGSLNS